MRSKAVFAIALVASMLATSMLFPVANAPPAAQDTLTVGVQNDTPNLHPWDIATNTIWKSFLWRQWVFEGLYRLHPEWNTTYAVLAEGNPIVDMSGLNVTVRIRTGVTFTDGQPMNATDVLFSYQVLAFNSQLSDPILKSIVYPVAVWPRWNATLTTWGAAHLSHVGITATDATTLVFHLRQPYSMFYFGTLLTPIMPVHVWKDHLVQVNLANYAIPGGTPISPTQPEFDLDTGFGSSPSDGQATIGTGPWYLVRWTPLVSAEIRVYAGYWGKSQNIIFQSTVYPFFPLNVRTILFRIYGTLDVAIFALHQGEVHVVPWSLPIGFYNDLKQEAWSGFVISINDRFDYLAFNLRKAPMSDLNFRKAVSRAIDKDFISARLMAGFGINGQVPVSPINPGYINSSAQTPSFDLSQANAILDAAGYAYSGQYRTMPGGAPLHLSILAPAKDYDPVRADAGIIISNSLKAVGLNIDSAPTAYDAIMSAVFSAVQFDMYILDWTALGPYPEKYLDDLFGCGNFAERGLGDNTPGYCNSQLEAYLATMDNSLNDVARIQAAKDAQGILVKDLPYNTFVVPRNIEGYRADVWCGWTPVWGEIFNSYSIGILGECPVPDYAPVQPQPVSPTGTPPSSSLSLSIQVQNKGGGGATANTTLIFYNESNSGIPFATFAVPPLMPSGLSIRFTVTWRAPSLPDVYHVTCEVNHDGSLVDSNASNNQYVWTINVGMPPLTLLEIGSPNYTRSVLYVTNSTVLELHTVAFGIGEIDRTLYRIDNATWLNHTAVGFSMPDEGEHYLEWYSVDEFGNMEPVRHRIIRVDDTPPNTSISHPPGDVKVNTPFTLTADDAGSGLKLIQYRVDAGDWVNYTAGFTLPLGSHTIYYRSTDNLSNIEPTKSVEVDVREETSLVDVMIYVLPLAMVIVLVIAIVAVLLRRRKKEGETASPPAGLPPGNTVLQETAEPPGKSQ